MSDKDNVENLNKGGEQKGGKVTVNSAFAKIKEAEVKAKGQELDNAVKEFLAADKARAAALKKVKGIEAEVKEIQDRKLPVV